MSLTKQTSAPKNNPTILKKKKSRFKNQDHVCHKRFIIHETKCHALNLTCPISEKFKYLVYINP